MDGHEYIDWVNCVSAVILGHADPVVNGVVKGQIDRGSLFTVNSPMEIELAELLVDTIPSAEMVRYCKGGGEACAMAVRIARGTNRTGQDTVLRLPRMARLVPIGELPGGPGDRRVSDDRHRADRRAQGPCRHGSPIHLRKSR